MSTVYQARLSNLNLTYCFRYKDTKRYLNRYIIDRHPEIVTDSISVADYEFDAWQQAGNVIDAFAEFCLLCEQTSQYLLAHNRCVFHAAALRFKDRAWLICAGSGVGKSTQCRYLTSLWPEEISIINGDKPILEYCSEEDAIIVHPSPWNGKEGWHGAPASKLSGIILLRRGEKNNIVSVKIREAVPWIYSSVFQSWDSKDGLIQAGKMAERIVTSVPCWMLTSHTVPDSTRLLYQTIFEESERIGI